MPTGVAGTGTIPKNDWVQRLATIKNYAQLNYLIKINTTSWTLRNNALHKMETHDKEVRKIVQPIVELIHSTHQ